MIRNSVFIFFGVILIVVTCSYARNVNKTIEKKGDIYFIDSLSYEILSSIKGEKWYSSNKVHLRWTYDMYGDCHCVFLGCTDLGDNLQQSDIDRFINELFGNKLYKDFIKNFSIPYCDAIKNGRVTNYISFECENLSKMEIRKIKKEKFK